MINIGVIGCGYWGPNLVRNFNECPKTNMRMVSDLSDSRLEWIKTRYPSLDTTNDFSTLINSPNIDAVAIATPVSTHFNIAKQALEAGKHVLVEKPMCMDPEGARQLVELAEKKGLTLMVDHTFIYTGAVRKVKELIQSGELGDVLYYDACRVNLGLFQHDVDVIWDLAIHDLSILDYLVDFTPKAVSATGFSHVQNSPENIAYLTIFFEEDFIAHVSVNWLAPVKIRRTLIGGSQKMIVFDDLDPSEKVKVYDKGITLTQQPEDRYKMLVGYRTGDIWAPQLDRTEALAREAIHFAECIENGTSPTTDGKVGMRVVKILSAASRSMKENGAPIKLED